MPAHHFQMRQFSDFLDYIIYYLFIYQLVILHFFNQTFILFYFFISTPFFGRFSTIL